MVTDLSEDMFLFFTNNNRDRNNNKYRVKTISKILSEAKKLKFKVIQIICHNYQHLDLTTGIA